jgi:hypothetical protein
VAAVVVVAAARKQARSLSKFPSIRETRHHEATVKNKALLLSLALLLGTLSCDKSTGLATTGSISVVLLSESGEPLDLRASEDGVGSAIIGSRANLLLSSVRVTVSGPTNRTVTVSTASGGFFNATVDGLAPGTYAVTVEGLVGTEVGHFGTTTGVSVSAGSSTPANITFPVFQPQLTASSVPDTTDVLRFEVTYPAVTGATSYIVQYGTSPTLAGASQVTVTTTTANVTVANEGLYYVRVRAVNGAVSGGGLASSIVTVFAFQGVATVTITPPTPSVAAGSTVQLTAEARDADNVVVPNVSWFWASDNHTIARVSQTGLVTGVAGGSVTITAVGKGMPGGTALTVSQSAAALAFSIQPGNATAGEALSPAVQIEVRDGAGNRMTSSRDPVTIAFANNAGGGTLTGTKTVNAVDGIASFTGLSINKAAAGYTLSATSGSLPAATSSAFTIAPAAAAKLVFTTQPVNAQGNVSMGSVTGSISDAFDNVVTSATNSVTLSIANNPWKGVIGLGGNLSATQLTVPAVAGVATFTNVSVDKPGVGYTLTAASPSLTPATSTPFNVNLTIAGSLTAGSNATHSCAVTTGGTYCWGNNSNLQLGALTGITPIDSIPALVRGGLTFTSVTAGGAHSCGLTAAGAAYCWGAGSAGRLGNGGTTSSDVPVAVVGGHVFAQIDAGSAHTCGVTTASAVPAEDRQVYCWGSGGNGQLGDGLASGTASTPVRVAEPLQTTFRAISVSAGSSHTCAVSNSASATSGGAFCWGFGGSGQVGDGAAASPLVPTLVTGLHIFTAISAGSSHSCGIVQTGPSAFVARCWGRNAEGQLGDGANAQQNAPALVAGALTTWTRISAGGAHSCGTAATITWCWGINSNGELGDDNANGTNTNQPTPVAGNLSFVSVDAGANHTCGRTASAAYCWGSNSAGRLGSPGVNQVKRAPTLIIQ